jgi:hypothetical protein
MPHLCILCPIENRPFTTSVKTSVEHKGSLPNIIKFSYCPYCNTMHGWTPDEAFFEDVHISSELTAGNAQQASEFDALPLVPQAMDIDISRTLDRIAWFFLGVFATLIILFGPFGLH